MDDVASIILDALDTGRQIAPITDSHPEFDLPAAYRTAAKIVARRIARGERPVGWKIGFTNRTIWDEYGVHAPIWGPVYESGVLLWNPENAPPVLDLEPFIEPRIEPEIILRLHKVPRADMDDRALLGCIDAVAHGFEIVQSVFPDWHFRAADTVAACALHGALVHGPLVPVDPAGFDGWQAALRSFTVELFRDGEIVDRGEAANVLDGPLSALRHFVAGMEASPIAPGLRPGDLISTGTLTRAFPLMAGQIWSTRLHGVALPGMRVRCGGGASTLASLVESAARARFNMENPQSCPTPEAYEQAVAAGVAAETAIARLLFGDASRLREARHAIAERAASLASKWKHPTAP